MVLKTTLYSYQAAGVDKLLPLKVGALYMEMGTGKTRTTLEIINRRLDAGKIDGVIWLCPCSVLANLRADVRKHADGTEMFAYCGIESLSSSIRLFDLLTSYASRHRCMLVVDESTLVKNPETIRTVRITMLAHQCAYRMILNGTPITRTEADLYAQWYILDWRILGYRSYWSFSANHLEIDPVSKRVQRALNTEYLYQKIDPYCYQVRKEECLELPEKKRDALPVWMTREQTAHYDEVSDAMIDMLDEQKPETLYRMFSALQAIISGRYVNGIYSKHLYTEPMFEQPEDNPRIHVLLKTVKYHTDGDKCLIFARYTHEIIDIIKALQRVYGVESAVPFFGELTRTARNRNIELFRGEARFMVANKTCAGYGLNLQFCHNLVYYSNDWDYATRAQSEDRVHRIGQDKNVVINDIYAVETLDERIMSCISRKERLVEELKMMIGKSSKEVLIKWLKSGSHPGRSD